MIRIRRGAVPLSPGEAPRLSFYRTIYIDPPWPEYGGGRITRGAQRHYPLMTLQQIYNLPVAQWARPNCHLYCWVTNNYLKAGLRAVACWDFRYITLITWMKDRQGLGQYYRGITEHCIFAVRGRSPYRIDTTGKRAQGLTGFLAPRGRHSEKPANMRRMIETVSYEPRLEVFARGRYPGWHVWGNEV